MAVVLWELLLQSPWETFDCAASLWCFRADTVIQSLLLQWEVVVQMAPGENVGYLERPNAYRVRSAIMGLFSSAPQRVGDLWSEGTSSEKVSHSTGRDSGMEGLCRTIFLSPLLVPPFQRCRNPSQMQSCLSNIGFTPWGVLTFSLSLCNNLLKWPWQVC